MVEVLVSVAAKLAEYLVDPTLQQLQYLFCVGKITINVENKKEELIFKQGWVQERVREAINRTDRIDGEVTKWQVDVERLRVEVENLEQELRANNGCLRGWCPTWRRYCLCKKLAKRTQRMIYLNEKYDCLNPISHPVIAPDIENHSSQNFKFFNSTQVAYNQLWEALQDDGISIIGLWGMGGSGKTSLVTEVKKETKDSGLFHQVVLTTISQNPHIRNIQGEIADQLGLKLDEESNKGRANRIALRLQSGERILMILDDIWTELNLMDIGIASGDEGPRYCKVLLTTRSQDVCSSLRCKKTIPLGLLTESEAWDLFQTHAKVDDGAIEVAQQVVTECSGLPIAIVVMGKCLRRKGLDEANVVLHKLRHSKPVDEDKAFTCLKLSYDYLRSEEAKSLFLMCAMFPEDHEIIIEDLFRYGVGLGLCEDADSFEIARSQVIVAINILIDSSLLMSSVTLNNEKCVKMHDMVRDVALWIAREEHRTIMVNSAKKLNELIVDEAVKDCYAVSSWYDNNELVQFPSQFVAPKLEFLLLHLRGHLDASHATFEGIKGLKALIIKCGIYGSFMNTWGRIEVQPQSLQHLSNLRTLRLRRWDLHDISFVVSLKELEILDLQGSKFEKMPNGIENLNKLKLLYLSHCTIDECCYEVIGRCLQLGELYVSMHLTHSKNVNCYEYLVDPIALKKLRRYKLEIGEPSGYWLFQNEGIRSLRLGQLNISLLGARIKDLIQRATAIQFYELEGGSKCFMPNIVQAVGSMNELTKLCLQKCSEIECINYKTIPHEDVVVSRLDELELEDMDNLRQLCCGPSSHGLFQKLERLSIFNCHKLLHIFPADCNLGNLKGLNISKCPMLTSLFHVTMACTLLSLEWLVIECCSELKHVAEVEGGGACEEQPMHDQDETQIVFPLLKYLHLKKLPKLVGICSEGYHPVWPSMKEIEWIDCPKMELKGHQLRNEEYKPLAAIEKIKVRNCGIESIFYYQIGVEEQIPKFQYLKVVTLKNCARLKFVFSAHKCQSLPELTSLTISGCEELETIFLWNEETQNNLSITESCLLKLYSLKISQCNKLKYVFMISAATSMLPQLSTLTVSNCSQMEEIFKCSNIEDHDINNNEREIMFPNMARMELKNLPRLINVCQGFKLQTREISYVKIYSCPKLIAIERAKMYCYEKGHNWDFTFGDDGQEETNDLERLRSEQQMLGGSVLTQLLSFQHLHSLEVTNSKNLKFLFSMSTIVQNSLPQLNSLSLYDCEELEMIFGHSGEDDANYGDTIVLSSLRRIELRNLPNFKSVCQVGLQIQVEQSNISICNCPKFVDSSLRWALQQLGTLSLPQVSTEDSKFQTSSRAECLRLADSMSLTSIWEGPTFIMFQNLKELSVSKCRRLKCILPSTVMRSLPCLWYLYIRECEELEEIIAKTSSDEDDANYGDTIVLSSLRTIQLTNLPNFKSVCQVGLQIQVELSNISICNCPKFIDSSLGWALQQLGTLSKLPQVSIENSNFQTSPNVEEELRGNDQRGMMSISRAEYLSLEDSVNLTFVWEGRTLIKFQNLKSLRVINCRKLKCILPSTVMRSLPCLENLWIDKCKELEEIMSSEEEEHNHFPNESSNNSLCFPQLRALTVKRCRKLKWLFPSLPSTQLLPQLYVLSIEGCSQIKGLFNCEPEIHEEGFYNNLLPELKHLEVQDCPIFSKITHAAFRSLQRQNSKTPFVDDHDDDDYDDEDDDDYDDDEDDYDDGDEEDDDDYDDEEDDYDDDDDDDNYNDDDHAKKRRKLA